MWKISVYSDDLLSGDNAFEANLAFLAEQGIEYVELRLIDGKNLMNMSDDEIDAVAKALKKHGMKVGGLGTPIFKCPLRKYDEPAWGTRHGYRSGDPLHGSAYEDHLKLLPRAFAIADRLNALNVRCFAFWRQFLLNDVIDEVAEKIGRAVDIAKASGHALALENEHNMIVGTGVELGRLIKEVNSPLLTGIYDLGNSWRRGGIILPDDMEALKGLISHIHVKHETIDIIAGCNTYGDPVPETDLGGMCFKFYGSWTRTPHRISGKLTIDGQEYEIIGNRTFVPVTKKLHIDHRAVFKALRAQGYTGLIAVDNNYFGSEVMENARTTLAALRQLIDEVGA